VSGFVLREASRGDAAAARKRLDAVAGLPILTTDTKTEALANALVAARVIPAEFPENALHVAAAAENGIEFLLTWNFSHLNNVFTKALIYSAVEARGFVCLEICTPEELFGDDL
jgi:hypothetical protein